MNLDIITSEILREPGRDETVTSYLVI